MKNRRTALLISSACLMMVYNLSCAHANFATESDANAEAATVADERFEHISVDPYMPEVRINSKKIIVQPVTRRVASEEDSNQ